MTHDITAVAEHVARAMHEERRDQLLRTVGPGRHAAPWEELHDYDRHKWREQVLPVVQLVLDAIDAEGTPDPLTQAADAVGVEFRRTAEQMHARALIAVLRVTGAVVVSGDAIEDATSGGWQIVATPDNANRSVEFSAQVRP